ncbi:hypothetical protein LTR17_000878 [Elasticomyces elasticus]|nr:hypothetical protein LTR17_000878 [Elasticomyces elasticus]
MELAKNTIERLVNSLTNDMLRLTINEADEPGPSFLTLPVELREMIYDYALADIVVRLGSRVWTASISPAILRTSKQIREEAIPSYYKSATFKVSQWDVLIRLLHPMPQHLRLAVPRIEYVVQMSSKARRDILNYKKDIMYWNRVLNRGLETQAYQLAPPVEHRHTLELYKMNAPPSRFLALPAELREKIYEFALADTIMAINGVVGWAGARASSRYPSLLAVSKQFHYEATSCFYKYSTFRITDERIFRNPGGDLHRWLRSVPTLLRVLIPSIEIFTPDNIHGRCDDGHSEQAGLAEDGLAIQDGVLKICRVSRASLAWVGAEQRATTPCPERIMCEPWSETAANDDKHRSLSLSSQPSVLSFQDDHPELVEEDSPMMQEAMEEYDAGSETTSSRLGAIFAGGEKCQLQ